MTAQRIPSIIFQSFYPGTNLPLIAGKVWTWKAGTTGDSNLQTTWSDASQNAENTNPVTLDPNGKANIFGGPNAYHILVLDSDGNTIDDQDNVFFGTPSDAQTTVASLADLRALPFGVFQFVVSEYRLSQGDRGGGEWDWNPDSSGVDDGILIIAPNSLPTTGRWIRRFNGPINAAWGGVLDNAQSINTNLATLMVAAGDRTVWFPKSAEGSGQYSITSNITLPAESSIQVDDGAFFSIDSGQALTLPGNIQKSPTLLFSGAGDVFINSPTREVYPEWFGATDRDDAFNNVPAIHKTFASCVTTQPVTFPGTSGYNCTTDPEISLATQIIINASDIYTQSTGDVYLKRGLHLPSDGSQLSGDSAFFYGAGVFGGNLDVAGALNVIGNFSTGGTFSAAALASLSGDVHSAQDVTAARDISATHDVISGRNVTAASGTVSGSSLTATNAVTGASYKLTGRPETLGVYNSIFSGDITLAFQAGTPSNIVKRASYVIPAGNTVIVQFYVEFDLSATATKLTITFANTGFSFQSILDTGFTSVSIGSAIKSGYSVATAAHAIDVFIDGGFTNNTGQILRGNIICEAIAP